MSEVDVLLATVVDDVLRHDLREWYEERAAICESTDGMLEYFSRRSGVKVEALRRLEKEKEWNQLLPGQPHPLTVTDYCTADYTVIEAKWPEDYVEPAKQGRAG